MIISCEKGSFLALRIDPPTDREWARAPGRTLLELSYPDLANTRRCSTAGMLVCLFPLSGAQVSDRSPKPRASPSIRTLGPSYAGVGWEHCYFKEASGRDEPAMGLANGEDAKKQSGQAHLLSIFHGLTHTFHFKLWSENKLEEHGLPVNLFKN